MRPLARKNHHAHHLWSISKISTHSSPFLLCGTLDSWRILPAQLETQAYIVPSAPLAKKSSSPRLPPSGAGGSSVVKTLAPRALVYVHRSPVRVESFEDGPTDFA